MATNIGTIVPYDTVVHFDRFAAQIEQTIDPLIDQLIERKITLLQEVAQLRDDFHAKEADRFAAIQELDQTQHQIIHDSAINIAVPIHEQASLVYQQGKEKLMIPTPLPTLRFSCPSLTLLQSQIQQFGEVVKLESPPLTQKREPILTAGKEGDGEKEFAARGLSLDEVNKKVYIADFGNNRIQVLSFDGDFLTQFGKKVLKLPWGISVTQDHVFVTDFVQSTLFQFCKNSHQLISATGGEGNNEGKLWCPMGLSVDCNGDVFVANFRRNTVSVFCKLLKCKQTIGQGSLRFPTDVKLMTDKVLVLDWGSNGVHLFSRGGELLTSCVSQGEGQECFVNGPFFLCLDSDGNIIISDCLHNDIKIVSNSGELLHTIGREGNGRGEFINPYGIAISNSGTIFVYSNNHNHSLQLF